MDWLKPFTTLAKQPYWVIALILGFALIAFPCISSDKDHGFSTHAPTTLIPVVVGIVVVVMSAVSFAFSVWSTHVAETRGGKGLNLTRVRETKEAMSTTVNGCEIKVANGRIENYAGISGAAIVLPCNEYFDDECSADTKSALGAYVNKIFDGRIQQFMNLVDQECKERFGRGTQQRKTDTETGISFGAGRCLLLVRPLDHSVPVALLSTTTQREGQGLSSRIPYLFDGMGELFEQLADARVTDAVMPVMGAGHGRIDAPLALVGLLVAVAEAARYGQGGQRLRSVTVVVFKKDDASEPQIDPVVVRRTLALIGTGE